MPDLIKALRPYQWSKNLLVFAALVFAQQLGNTEKVTQAAIAFVVFCAASSAVYLLNDVLDRERDRQHPDKAQRPIAAGRVSVGTAVGVAVVIAAGALAGAWFVNRSLLLVIGGYFALQLAYNAGLKQVTIIDALCVATGFLLRAVAGAVAINEEMSSWLLICTTFATVFISFAKRRHEYSTLQEDAEGHRESLSGYSAELLDQFLVISAAGTLLSYALYTSDRATVEKFGSNRLIFTLPFVMYGLFRYMTLVSQDKAAGDPSVALVRDKPLVATIVLWGMVVVALLYFR